MNPRYSKGSSKGKPAALDPMFAPGKKPSGKLKLPANEKPQVDVQPLVSDRQKPVSSDPMIDHSPKEQFDFNKYVFSYRTKRAQKNEKKKRSKLFKAGATFAVLLLIVGGYSAFRLLGSANNVFSGSYLDMLSREALAADEYGRTNILVFGTSEDNAGHSGAELTDSIMLVSVDQDTKASNVISIPRDLWVKYGEPCPLGQEGKINSVYSCSLQNGKSEEEASMSLAKSVSQVIGTEVPYFAKVNYTVLRDLVNELGGIEVVIESSDPRGIQDRSMDDKCPNGPYTCYMVNHPNGPAKLDGNQALALARARNAKGGYGLSRGNFDREKNQQKIVRAIQKKALSTGTLTNPNRVFGIADSLGNNIVTNFKTSQVQTLIEIARHVNSDKAKTIDLADDEQPLVTTGSYGGQSIVRPMAGVFEYSDIHQAVREAFAPKPDPSDMNSSLPESESR